MIIESRGEEWGGVKNILSLKRRSPYRKETLLRGSDAVMRLYFNGARRKVTEIIFVFYALLRRRHGGAWRARDN